MDTRQERLNVRPIGREEYEIIGVSNVVPDLESPFCILIELIHVDIDQELGCEIAQGQTGRKTADDLPDECPSARARDMLFYDTEQRGVIYRCEEFSYITFQYPARASVIARDTSGESCEALHGTVRALALAAGIGIGDECAIEIGIQNAVHSMVQEAIANGGLVNIARLWVCDLEAVVRAVRVGTGGEIRVECQDILHESVLEFQDIGLAALARQELFPRL